MQSLGPSEHYCPRQGCARVVPNRLFACRADWYALPADLRRIIDQTAHLSISHPARQEVFADARQAWGETATEADIEH